jgi:hypothetical protein
LAIGLLGKLIFRKRASILVGAPWQGPGGTGRESAPVAGHGERHDADFRIFGFVRDVVIARTFAGL